MMLHDEEDDDDGGGGGHQAKKKKQQNMDVHEKKESEHYVGEDEEDELSKFEVSDMHDFDPSPSMVSLLGGQEDLTSSRPLPSLTRPAVPRDVLYAALFLLHLIVSLTAGFSVGDIVTSTQRNLVSLNSAVVVFSTFYSIIWLFVFVAQMKRTFLWSSFALSLLGLIPMSVFFLLSRHFIGVVFGCFAIYVVMKDCIWMLTMRGRFDFLTVLLEIVTRILHENRMVVYCTAVFVVVHSVWAIWCSSVIARIGDADLSWSWTLLWMYFHFYWTSHVIRNCITMVVSGTVMMWYHGRLETSEEDKTKAEQQHGGSSKSSNSSSTSSNKSNSIATRFSSKDVFWHYIRCTFSTSFGSVCVGSLFSPVAHILWTSLRHAKREDAGQLQTVLFAHPPEKLEQFIQNYHKYSFTHVAAYGMPFHVAARQTWHAMEQRGVEAIIDDDLTSRLLLFAANGCAGLVTVLCGAALFDTTHWTFGAILFFILAYTTTSIATQMVVATVKTLFVCFAENPRRLSQLHPIIYHRLVRISEMKHFREEQQQQQHHHHQQQHLSI